MDTHLTEKLDQLKTEADLYNKTSIDFHGYDCDIEFGNLETKMDILQNQITILTELIETLVSMGEPEK